LVQSPRNLCVGACQNAAMLLRRPLSARLERHLERGEELMELNRAEARRNTAAFERLMKTLDRHEAAFVEHEKAFGEHEKAFGEHEKAFAKHEEVMKRVSAALERHESREDDLKTFIREQNRRSEKIIQEMLRRNEAFNVEQSRRTDQIVAELREGRAESKAQTEALLRLIDRFPPPAEAA